MGTKIQLHIREGLLMDARTLNISESGMAIVTDGPLVPGLVLTSRCHLLVAGERVELATQVRVVHSVFSNADGDSQSAWCS
ncbi:PilZ domain-containing protein [Roseateles sp. NT4]|uniref:PilZ domain-containing protein n=1 Tax=Roseateles sp. NT4 TaxID=3453715 RepID=UPI003EEFDDCF